MVGSSAFVFSMVASIGNSFRLNRHSLHGKLRMSMSSPKPPVANKIPSKVYFGVNPSKPEEHRGDHPMDPPQVRFDNYFWLRDETREKKDVLDYIKAENAYTEEMVSSLSGLRDDLYADMLRHLKETDEDVPYRYGSYYYYSRTVQGVPYHINCRTPVEEAPLTNKKEEVILDENVLAEGFEYSEVSSHGPCPAHRFLAYAVDHDGYETYTLEIKDLQTGVMLPDRVEEISGDFCWGADSSTLFYLKMDEEHRPNRLYMHIMGTDPEDDVLLLTEEDSRFWMCIDKSSSDRFIFVTVESKETSEVRVIDLQGVKGSGEHASAVTRMTCVQPRVFGLRYDIEHHGDFFYLVTNHLNAKNNRLVFCPIATPSAEHWIDVVPYNASIQIDEFLPFKGYFAVFGRTGGFQTCWVLEASKPTVWTKISLDEEVCSVSSDANFMYDATVLRLRYSSLLTPSQVIDYDMKTGVKLVLKQKEVPLYDPSLYQSVRLEATAADGTKIPMSVVHRKDADFTKQARPTLLYGYGSYGVCIEPSFDYKKISLLDRGIVYVIAHIRGGGEMGKSWYEDQGKYLTKKNTFTDFIDCAKHLTDLSYTSSDQLAILGRSAGGLLIGAVVNMAPTLFKCAVADVPFVDCLNSMSDPTIPLTVSTNAYFISH